MTRPIAIFFHGLFVIGGQVLPNAGCIIANQIVQMMDSGLWLEASEINFGINGGDESKEIAENIIPPKAFLTFHGVESRSENLTVLMVEEWVKTHPHWNVLYLHGKGCSHPPDSHYGNAVSAPWREAMMQDLVINWRQCVDALETHDIVCSRWLWNMGWDLSQHIPAGNFLWLTSNFARQLPSLLSRTRIKEDGPGALSARYEAEVHWGNGPKPNVKSWRPNGGGGIP